MLDSVWIDDAYIYRAFPLPERMSRDSLLSLVQLEQYTSIQDLLGTCLYEDLTTKVEAQTLSAEEEELFKLVKYALALYTSKAAISILRTETSRTKNEERQQDQYVLDTIHSTVESKIAYVNKRVTNYITSVTAIHDIATADGCTDDLFEEDDNYQGGSVFYPNTPSSGDCEDGVTYNL